MKYTIGFWKTKFGKLFSHNKGLTKDEVEFLQTLQEGDRIVLSPIIQKFEDTSPDFILKRWLSEEEYAKKAQ